ncbi:hypothetical protein HTZ77_06480 [Nonomuraea sp. SMC257]|uniref:Uncharacterized protein n=1 Tax=Nonomuraea montanisoli TaxID=2741721 RepID=A0A7Y6M239_9ACTN|nr:hypothetical protein [Nonomuraea montanisoli]NUW31066.1 hypothetical protein [Nonomuraea montanisoli]
MGDPAIWRIDREAQDALREQRSQQDAAQQRQQTGRPPADAGTPHGHRPPSQLRSIDAADGDPAYQEPQGRGRGGGDGSAQKPTEPKAAEQAHAGHAGNIGHAGHAGHAAEPPRPSSHESTQHRTDFHGIVSGPIPRDSPGSHDHRPGTDSGTGGQRP